MDNVKIIFLNGPPSSGKDTAANHLHRNYPNSTIIKFSEPLKIASHALMDLTCYTVLEPGIDNTPYVLVQEWSWYFDKFTEPQEVFFGLTPQQVYEQWADAIGKSINNKELQDKKFPSSSKDDLYYEVFRDSDNRLWLKIILTVHAIYGLYTTTNVPSEQRKNYVGVLRADFFENTKELRSHLFNLRSPRSTYIWLSEDVLKPNFDIQHFGKVAVTRMKNILATHPDTRWHFYISDSGFESEAQPVIKTFEIDNCVLFRIYAEGRGKTFAGDSRAYLTLPITTHDLHNDIDGKPELFCQNLIAIVTHREVFKYG